MQSTGPSRRRDALLKTFLMRPMTNVDSSRRCFVHLTKTWAKSSSACETTILSPRHLSFSSVIMAATTIHQIHRSAEKKERCGKVAFVFRSACSGQALFLLAARTTSLSVHSTFSPQRLPQQVERRLHNGVSMASTSCHMSVKKTCLMNVHTTNCIGASAREWQSVTSTTN